MSSNPSSPKPSYAAIAASPARNRGRSPSPGSYRPTIRIPALGRLIQAKPAENKSKPSSPGEPTQSLDNGANTPKDNEPATPTDPTPTPAEMEGVASTSSAEQSSTPIKKLTKQEKAKAKKARQAARKAMATPPSAASSATLPTEVVPPNARPHTEVEPSTLNEVEGEPRTESPASSTPSTPRLTAAAKGKGRATPFSDNFFTLHTLDFANGGEGPPPTINNNKRKADESPVAQKIVKRNTSSANPPLSTPTRLTIQNVIPSTTAAPEDEWRLQVNANLVLRSPKTQTSRLPPHTTPSMTSHPTEDHRLPQTRTSLALGQPSTEELERNVIDHIRMKPSFCGTEVEFNEKTMKLQELLAAAIIADQADAYPPIPRESASSYNLPPPRQNSTHSNYNRYGDSATPTPSQRCNPPIPSHTRRAHSSQGIPNTRRNPIVGTPYPHAPLSDRRDYLPPVSPRSFDDDSVSMVDSEPWPITNFQAPPTDTWEEDNVPPPYANSQRNSPPHQYSPPPQTNLHHNYLNATSVTDAEGDLYGEANMQIDDPRSTWEPADTPGVVVNGEGLEKTERPPNGWPRPEMRSLPTEDIAEESLNEINDAPPHALWFLEHCADYDPLKEQSIVDAIRSVLDKLISVPRGKRVGVIFPTRKSSPKKASRFAKPLLYLIKNITPEQSALLANYHVISTNDLSFWMYPKHFPKSHFGGTIAGLHHKKEEHEEVLETIIEELLHRDHAELARFVTHNSLPYDREAYRTLITNLQIEFVDINHNRNKPSTRAWNLILPPNNLNDQTTFEFIVLLSKVKIRTDGAGLGRFLDLHEIPLCEGCKGLGHYYKQCPYNTIPGWFGTKPETTAEKTQPSSWTELYEQDRAESSSRGRGRGQGTSSRARGNRRGNAPRGGRGNGRGSRYNPRSA